MADNSADKGSLTVYLKKIGQRYFLNKMSYSTQPDEVPFYVNYENGVIRCESGDWEEKLGSYDTTPSTFGYCVYDLKKHLIGYVTSEDLYFCRQNGDSSAGGFEPVYPKSELLATYSRTSSQNGEQSGIIKYIDQLTYYGYYKGSPIGAAATFIALFKYYPINSVFYDYFTMEEQKFSEKYPRRNFVKYSLY